MRSGSHTLASPTLAAILLALSAVGTRAQVSWRDVTMSRQVAAESTLAVEVGYGAGDLRIRPGGEGTLYRMQLRYDEGTFVPVAAYESGRLRVGVEGANRRGSMRRDISGGEMDLELATGLPMALQLEFGAVRADLDLGGLSLTDLHLRTGASETRLDISSLNPVRLRTARLEVGAADFTARRLGNLNTSDIRISAGVGKVTLDLDGEWQSDATVDVNMGLGSLDLVLPEGLGVRLVRKTLLTSLDTEGLVKRGDDYYSPDWDSAKRRITVDVDAAFGSIKVSWIR
jgi:hypothetical protein